MRTHVLAHIKSILPEVISFHSSYSLPLCIKCSQRYWWLQVEVVRNTTEGWATLRIKNRKHLTMSDSNRLDCHIHNITPYK